MRPSLAATLLLATGSSLGQTPPHRTDWFQRAGYGVFVHYLNGLQNGAGSLQSLGRETSWEQCVREFDVDRFAATMHEVGAGYVIFTVMQISRHLIAPNATFDRIAGYQPGEACATRDLIADLSAALQRYQIPLLLYYTGDGPRGDAQAGPAFECSDPVTPAFVTKWAAVAEEYSRRYGDRIAGWWVDGCYPFIGYTDATLAILARALRAGNPNALVAFNRGVDPLVLSYTKLEDYTTGEQNTFYDLPVQRFLDGEQWHLLSYLGNWWGGAGSKYTKQELAEYVFDVHQRGGVVSIDVLLYRDGALDRSQVELLKAVRHGLDTFQALPQTPPGNLAYRKPAQLLSLDGSHELQINSGVHGPRRGVDGKPETVALAGGEWPWAYHVDLVDTHPVRRVKVTFGQGYATHLQLMLSADGQTWQTVYDQAGLTGQPVDTTFAPVVARYLRVCALKPDGPNQPGAQMSVAEVEVYD